MLKPPEIPMLTSAKFRGTPLSRRPRVKREQVIPPADTSKQKKEKSILSRLHRYLPLVNLAGITVLFICIITLFSFTNWAHSGEVTKKTAKNWKLSFILTPNESVVKMLLPFKYEKEISAFFLCCRSLKGRYLCNPSNGGYTVSIFGNNTLSVNNISTEFIGAACVLRIF